MSKLKTLLIILFIAGYALNSSGQNHIGVLIKQQLSASYIQQHLVQQHPRLILTPLIEKLLLQKIKSDTLVKIYYAFLEKEAFKIAEMPLIKKELTGFRFPNARESLRRLATLSIVYRVNKNPKLLNRINEELKNISTFDDWNPQHFLDVAQVALGVSLAIDWNAYALPKETIKLAKNALIEKAIIPSYDTAAVRMGWVSGNNNWNAVCHGGMIAASLASADVNPELAAKTISRAIINLPNSLKEYAPQGVHPEGPFYWRFGTSYTAVASNLLTTALGRDFGISKSHGFMQTADYRLQITGPSGLCFNYADSDGKTDGEASTLLAWFAAQTGNGNYINKQFFRNPLDPDLMIPDDEDALIPQNEGRLAGLALIWLAQCSFEKTTDLPLAWYGKGEIPIVVFRSEKKALENFYLAAKGGSGLVSHGNMDAGTFVFELNGVRWAIDPGNQSYFPLNKIGFQLANSKQESERWTLLTKNNFGHSTVTVNDNLFNVKGNVSFIDFKEGLVPEATLDLTDLYSGNVKSITRKFVKENNHSLIIEDQFEINKATKNITWQMITTADVMLIKNGAILKKEGKILNLTVLSKTKFELKVIDLDPPPLSIDKQIKNLKRIEISTSADDMVENVGSIKVRLSDKNITD
jgi:hypothetical protein